MSSERRYGTWTSAIVLVVAGAISSAGCAAQSNHTDAPQSAANRDCSVVEQLGPEWTAMQRSVVQQGKSATEKKDLLAVADVEAAMGDKIRAAQSSVAAPELKAQLGKWAEGTALSAKAQRAEASPTPDPAPSDPADADTVRAGRLISDATAALRQACPQLKLP
ncbi:hypothetical protein ACTXG7_14175 [Mycolicibacterium sp. Dal123E01]|uniref:hypothetical protein n=1 Tax=Mycolicibacterium sp. Dal123E01 TaxID=3457578 RepID=UPI00403EE51A